MALIYTTPGFEIRSHLTLLILDDCLKWLSQNQLLLAFKIRTIFVIGTDFCFDGVLDLGFVRQTFIHALSQEGRGQTLLEQELEREGVLAHWRLPWESEHWDFHPEKRLVSFVRQDCRSRFLLIVLHVRFCVPSLEETVFWN